MWTVPFSAKQQEYLQNATRRWNIKTGATRSGKTFLDILFVIPKRITSAPENGHILLVGNSQQSLTRNIIDPMREIWGPGLIGQISATTGTVKLFGRKCYALGADNKARVKTIQGMSVVYCYGDEMTTWSESFFTMLKSRLDKPDSRFDGTCNPDTPQHWVKKFLDSGADIYQQAYTIDDNPFLSPDFVANLKKEYAGTVFYDRYILGLWTLAQGLIYSNFRRDTMTYEQMDEKVRRRCVKYVAIDYGTANPCVYLYILFDPITYTVYVDRESYYDGRKEAVQRTDAEHGEALRKFVLPEDVDGGVILDPSALSFRVLVRQMGYRLKEANNDVIPGIRQTASLMSLGKIKVNVRCKNLLEEFGAYMWDMDAAAATGVDRPIKQFDHACDALRYFCFTAVNMRRAIEAPVA